ncbi:MAG: hypothetical protein FD167_5204 [bacterium]|nr:MAG: hypothetical protein FD167_5204 [bacterium]
MTDRELLELILKEITELKKGQARLEFRQEQLEVKQDALEELIIEKISGLKLETMRIDEKLDRLFKQETEFKTYRRSSQGVITDLQVRQEHLEEDVRQIRKVLELDKAS